MSRRRAAVLTAGLAAGAVATGVVGRAILVRRRPPDPEAGEVLSRLPPEDIGPVFSSDGTSLCVRACGDPSRPPLVFVHGFSLDMTAWHYQWTALSKRFRCVLFDLRSHGRSGKASSGDISLRAMGHDLAAVLQAAAPDRPAVVVGHSMGGMTILALAESRPELFGTNVAGVVFVGTAASDLLRGAMGSVTELLRPRFGSLAKAAHRVDRLRKAVLASPADVGGVLARVMQFGPDASPHLVDHVVGLAARAPSEVWTDGLAGLMDMDLRHAVGHVTTPALVAVGDHDRVTPPASAMALAAELPDARFEVIPGAGHMAMLEAHQAFNHVVTAFADGVFESKREPNGQSKGEPKRRSNGNRSSA